MNKPSWIINEPSEVYHAKAKEYLSSHQLADFRTSPVLFWKKRKGLIIEEDRPSYILGSASHTLILEGRDVYESTYAIGGPINPSTGKSYGVTTNKFKEWADSQSKKVLTTEDAEIVELLNQSVEGHYWASRLLSDGFPECVVRSEYCGVQSQIRIDYLKPIGEEFAIIDFKSCESLDWFEYDAKKYGYINQSGFYRRVTSAFVNDDLLSNYIIAVEKKEPYRCGVWEVSKDRLELAIAENEAAIAELNKCSLDNVWPTGYENLRVF